MGIPTIHPVSLFTWFGPQFVEERAFQKFIRCYLFANRSDRPTGKEISRAQFSLIFPIGDIQSILFKLLQQLLCLWFLLAEWSVLQPSVNPVVGSSQPLCRKLSFFWLFSVFCSFSLEFLHVYRAFTVLILINYPCIWGRSFCVVFFVSHLALLIRGFTVHFSSYLSTPA